MLIPRSILNLTGAASKDGTRANLNAVYFERQADGRCRATATDGHELVTATWIEPDSLEMRVPGFACLIAASELDRAVKIAPKVKKYQDPAFDGSHYVLPELADGSPDMLAIADGDKLLTVPVTPLDAEFPDYHQVLPKNRENHTVGLNPALMNRVLAIVDKLTPKTSRTRGVKVEVAAGEERGFDGKITPNSTVMPVRVTRTDPDTGIELEALVMPMRL